jgi:Penicillin binding protein transpeptidase domain
LLPPVGCGILWLALLLSCSTPARGQSAAAVESFARDALHAVDASGFVHVRDVRSGEILAHVATSDGDARDLEIDSFVRPLSVVKVLVAMSWLEHGLGALEVPCSRPLRRMQVDEILVSGCDSAGAEMAVSLRRRIGGSEVLRDLRRFGFRHVALRADATDAGWGAALSLGEEAVAVTPRELSSFFAAIGRGGGALCSAATAGRLRSALEAVVARGTATAIEHVLAGTGWSIGGKTGTGPGQCGDHCDGWFASLLSDRSGGRYAILVFIRGKGRGGGVAAGIASSVAKSLITTREPDLRGAAIGHLANAEDHELRGARRGEPNDDRQNPRIDIRLRHRLPVALDEIRFAFGGALKRTLQEQRTHEHADVAAEPGPQALVVRLENSPLDSAVDALLEIQRQAADRNVFPLRVACVVSVECPGAPDDA